ncbi:MAG: D-cysteine desulfhydrase family protein [Pseudomonadota bacterium]
MTDVLYPAGSGNRLEPLLAHHPRVDLRLIETPLEPLERYRAELGVELQIKREDILPLGMGGNKIRQLEFYLGPAVKAGADTVVITGAVQSNFVCLCAAACRKLGMEPVLQLENRAADKGEAYHKSGNVLLERMLGAEIRTFPVGEDEAAADASLDAIAAELKADGRRPYVIHLGTDSPPRGALGYTLAAEETMRQCDQSNFMPDHIVMPSGSGITHSGFLVGARALGWDVKIDGICVRRSADLQHQRVLKRALETSELLGQTDIISEADVRVHDEMLAPSYGSPSDFIMQTVHRAARLEGLFMDPVYVGRGFAGMVDLVERGEIFGGAKVLFLHTGGTPGIFAYQDELLASAGQ